MRSFTSECGHASHRRSIDAALFRSGLANLHAPLSNVPLCQLGGALDFLWDLEGRYYSNRSEIGRAPGLGTQKLRRQKNRRPSFPDFLSEGTGPAEANNAETLVKEGKPVQGSFEETYLRYKALQEKLDEVEDINAKMALFRTLMDLIGKMETVVQRHGIQNRDDGVGGM